MHTDASEGSCGLQSDRGHVCGSDAKQLVGGVKTVVNGASIVAIAVVRINDLSSPRGHSVRTRVVVGVQDMHKAARGCARLRKAESGEYASHITIGLVPDLVTGRVVQCGIAAPERIALIEYNEYVPLSDDVEQCWK